MPEIKVTPLGKSNLKSSSNRHAEKLWNWEFNIICVRLLETYVPFRATETGHGGILRSILTWFVSVWHCPLFLFQASKTQTLLITLFWLQDSLIHTGKGFVVLYSTAKVLVHLTVLKSHRKQIFFSFFLGCTETVEMCLCTERAEDVLSRTVLSWWIVFCLGMGLTRAYWRSVLSVRGRVLGEVQGPGNSWVPC